MEERNLKIKQKQSTIKTKGGKNTGKRQNASPIKEKMKADYIRTKTRQTSEKETSEVSNQAEEVYEDTGVAMSVYAANHLGKRMPVKKVKRYKTDDELQKTMSGMDVSWNLEQQQQVFKKKYAVEKGKRIKEKQYKKANGIHRESVILQEQQKQVFLPTGRKNYRIPMGAELEKFQKKQKGELSQKQQKIEEKRYAVKTLKERFYQKNTTRNSASVKQKSYRGRMVNAVTNTVTAFVKSVLAALGGLSGLTVIFVIVGAVLALVSTAFGIFFSAYDDTAGTKRIAEIVAETNSEFYAKVDDIEHRVSHDQVKYHVVPEGGDQLFITNWTEVVAVFAAKITGVNESAMDVITMDDIRVEGLKKVFWDMNELSYKTETVKHGEDKETVLQITLNSRGYEEMVDFYNFTPYQKQALDEIMQPEYAQMLSELVGTLGVTGSNIELTPAQLQEMLENLPNDLSPERRAVMKAAYSLVGKVNYFWGGKSEVIGWDSRWGTPMKVTSVGSNTTGMTLPFGLDCSGFVTWIFINATGDSSYANIIGHGARNQYGRCEKISWSEALPGDLVFYPDLGHVGIVAGKDDNGNLLIVHCASSQNSVVVTGLQGFTKIGRPILYYN